MSNGNRAADPRVHAAIVLAAGGSSRMGTPKALLSWHGTPLIARWCAALAPIADRVIVVVGAAADAVTAALPAGVVAVENRAWATTTPIDSLHLALTVVDVVGAAVVTPVDVAPARPDTLRALIAALGDGRSAVPVDPDGRDGHPVALDPALVAAIRARPIPGGLRAALSGAARIPVGDPAAGDDFDDPAAWARAVRASDPADRSRGRR
ncbi:MAG: nucleotidyltransferase family protein [Myxococcota bacterium]